MVPSPPALLLLSFLLLLLLPTPTTSRAFLALDRTLETSLVSDLNTTIHYSIHNVGDGDASDISLKDTSFPASRFQIHTGAFRHSIVTLPAGDAIDFKVIVAPKRAGELFVSPASVTYKDEEGEKRICRFAAGDSVVVEDLKMWKRRTDKHGKEWFAYFIAVVVLVAGPWGVSSAVERGIEGVYQGGKKNN